MVHEFVLHRSKDYGKVPEPLIHDVSVSDGAVRLYAHLHWRAGKSLKSFESQQTMANRLDVSDRTIKNRLTELEQRDWVLTVRQSYDKDTGKYSTNTCHVFELQEDCKQFRKHLAESQNGAVAKPKPLTARPKKSRKKIGGKPSHRRNSSSPGEAIRDSGTKTATVGTQVPLTVGTQVPTYPEAIYPEKDKDSATADAVALPSIGYKDKNATKPMTYAEAMNRAICSVFNWDWDQMPKNERGKVTAASKQLREVNVSVHLVPALYRECEARYDQFGPNALCGVVSDVRAGRGKTQQNNGAPNAEAYQETEPASGNMTALDVERQARLVKEYLKRSA